MLELKNVNKSYGKTQALKQVDLELPQGEIIGLFGENGAGKTTLMKCILGFLPYMGEIRLDGEKITEKNIPHQTTNDAATPQSRAKMPIAYNRYLYFPL